mmetsp:Transcript_68528/g.150753  ORF Transcript_68528/g.150753 Transcript_68528/m.150753 type:complete len:223 (-) Transcript_68528:789-1457(-)
MTSAPASRAQRAALGRRWALQLSLPLHDRSATNFHRSLQELCSSAPGSLPADRPAATGPESPPTLPAGSKPCEHDEESPDIPPPGRAAGRGARLRRRRSACSSGPRCKGQGSRNSSGSLHLVVATPRPRSVASASPLFWLVKECTNHALLKPPGGDMPSAQRPSLGAGPRQWWPGRSSSLDPPADYLPRSVEVVGHTQQRSSTEPTSSAVPSLCPSARPPST